MSFAQYRNNQIDKNGSTSERLLLLVKGLARSDVPTMVARKEDLFKKSSKITFSNNAALLPQITGQRFSVNANDSSLPVIDAADRQHIIERLAESRPKIEEAYSQALALDPELTVTVTYEVTINKQGVMEFTGFSHRGRATPIGIAKLREGFTRVFEGLTLELRFAGLKIRGENAFVH